MTDDDRATELEIAEREARIAAARRVIPIHERPALDCWDCSGFEQAFAKEHCQDYAACLADWQKEQRMSRINGKTE